MAMAFENPVFTTRKHIGNHGFRNSGIDKSTDLCVIEDYTKISMIYHFPTEETIPAISLPGLKGKGGLNW